MTPLYVERLRPEQIRLVFPLLREVELGVDLAAWMRFARAIVNRRSAVQAGILVARRSADSFPSGLLCYQRDRDLQFGMVLTVNHLVAADILDPAPVLTALMTALDKAGADGRCGAIRFVVRHGRQDLTDGLLAAGHFEHGLAWCKRIAAD